MKMCKMCGEHEVLSHSTVCFKCSMQRDRTKKAKATERKLAKHISKVVF